jgi:hypothetical protein
MQVEPRQQIEIPGVGDLRSIEISTKNAMRASTVKELIDAVEGVIGSRPARITAHRALSSPNSVVGKGVFAPATAAPAPPSLRKPRRIICSSS